MHRLILVILIPVLFAACSSVPKQTRQPSSVTKNETGYVALYNSPTSGPSVFNIAYIFSKTKKRLKELMASPIGATVPDDLIVVETCGDREDFISANYTAPSVEDAISNLSLLHLAQVHLSPIEISYWDNGEKLSGKCILNIQNK